MSWDDMAAKMNGLVGPVLGLEAAAELLSLARAFGDGRSLARLRRILAA
jgi:hypothetical protein